MINKEYSEREICNIAFILFFYGVGDESDKAVDYFIGENNETLLSLSRGILLKMQNDFITHYKISNQQQAFERSVDIIKSNTIFTLEITYYPFDGHSSRLGHYFRHLYQSVKYIVDDRNLKDGDSIKLTDEQKQEYLRTLRAQLSNHEQLLLYYDALSNFGSNWIKYGFLTDYRMIHNLPLAYADFGEDPMVLFKDSVKHWKEKGKRLFEWERIN